MKCYRNNATGVIFKTQELLEYDNLFAYRRVPLSEYKQYKWDNNLPLSRRSTAAENAKRRGDKLRARQLNKAA